MAHKHPFPESARNLMSAAVNSFSASDYLKTLSVHKLDAVRRLCRCQTLIRKPRRHAPVPAGCWLTGSPVEAHLSLPRCRRSSDEAVCVCAAALEEQNQLKEEGRAAAEPTSPPPPPTVAPVPVDPCEGQKHAAQRWERELQACWSLPLN